MLDTHAETSQDRRPAILVCVYEADDPAWAALDDPSAEPWSPAGARTRSVGPGDPAVLAGLISDELSGTDVPSVLLVGRTRRSDGFRVQMRAENRGLTGGGKLSKTGPALARATAPVAEIVRALNDAGFRNEASTMRFDSGDRGSGGQPRTPWQNAAPKRDSGTDTFEPELLDQTAFRTLQTRGRYDLMA
jgi:hypothetical protein